MSAGEQNTFGHGNLYFFIQCRTIELKWLKSKHAAITVLIVDCRVKNLAFAIALVPRWVCAAMACAKCEGKSKLNLLKNAKGRLFYFLVCPTF